MDPKTLYDLDEFGFEILETYKKKDYGPIDHIDKSILKYFVKSSYATVQPKCDKLIKLYKIQNLDKKYSNSFWTTQEILSNFTYLNANNTINSLISLSSCSPIKNSIIIPECFRLMAGQFDITRLKNWTRFKKLIEFENENRDYLNDLILVFIPNEYIEYMIKFQNGRSLERLEHMKLGLIQQKIFFKSYVKHVNSLTQQYLEKHLTLKRAKKLAIDGNNLKDLPMGYRKALKALTNSSTLTIHEPLANKIFRLHTETVELPDGRTIELILTVTAIYEGYVKYNNKKNKIIHKYNLKFDWI
jgi:hypothetical protein